MTPSEKRDSQAAMFGNRLRKRTQHFKKWAKHLNISAYRIYDRDIPEIPLCVDLYTFTEGENAGERYAVYSLFERPYEKDPAEEDLWLDAMSHEIERILELPADHVISKLRRRQKGNVQYEKTTSRHAAITGIISEGNLKFGVNLTDFLDTGLFLDHRPLRKILTESTHHKRVLNLFAYTGSLSVAALKGGADYVQSVDLSNTYLDWAIENMHLNGFNDGRISPVTRMDVMAFLDLQIRKTQSGNASRFNVILLDPPTFSNSKRTDNVLDINRDWPKLVHDALSLLAPGGILYFSTNSRRLKFDRDELPYKIGRNTFSVHDITDTTIPEDFKAHRIHRCWKFQLDT
ncbi:MAG: class I SAM-dependent methyltransferase [Proteobacteria bacterium]|jgi:23S rRNA (cytosine1962-C5)-methyltransferase|nr:class I SAM-dependent methyltransferase [Pseudomonadota bacterium]